MRRVDLDPRLDRAACLCYFSAWLLQPCWKRNLLIMRKRRVCAWILRRCVAVCTERHYYVGYSINTVPWRGVSRRVDRISVIVLQMCDICFGLLGSGIFHMLPTLGFLGGCWVGFLK